MRRSAVRGVTGTPRIRDGPSARARHGRRGDYQRRAVSIIDDGELGHDAARGRVESNVGMDGRTHAMSALIRDFSPQLGRASAMGFWTLGPVLGSLVVSIQVSNTSDSTAWQDH